MNILGSNSNSNSNSKQSSNTANKNKKNAATSTTTSKIMKNPFSKIFGNNKKHSNTAASARPNPNPTRKAPATAAAAATSTSTASNNSKKKPTSTWSASPTASKTATTSRPQSTTKPIQATRPSTSKPLHQKGLKPTSNTSSPNKNNINKTTPIKANHTNKPSRVGQVKPTKQQPTPKSSSSSSTPAYSPSTPTASPTGSIPSLAERNSSNYTATNVEAAYRAAPPHKWKTQTLQFHGSLAYMTIGEQKEVRGKSIPKGIAKFQSNPAKYSAMMYQTSMLTKKWHPKDCSYTLVMRQGTTQLKPQGVDPQKGWMTLLLHDYQHLPPLPNNNVLPVAQRDPYTWNMTFQGRPLHSPRNPPLLPGRGMGVGDTPSLKIIGDVDPSDIHQGLVGDCWLLSAISAIAEFDGAIKRLFRKTRHIDQMPLEHGPNFYTISLYDLETWQEVDIVVDESLCASPHGDGNLLASRPSEDGELWVCYLEKALAIHCGGWDEITGGQCTHAWAIMTGCREQYTIARNPATGKFYCMAKFNPTTQRWNKHYNSPHHKNNNSSSSRGSNSDAGMWKVPWPRVGGGGSADQELTEDELYRKMCAWDRENFIVGAGTKGLSDKNQTGGMVDNHAYSVIDCHPKVAGTHIDLMKVRNPWGQGEIEDGLFDDDGPGWNRYPQIKATLNPVVADDGIFYLTKDEFFKYFDHIYVSASNMTVFKED